MERNKAVSAIILAAGLSCRMKAFKPLLPLGEKTMVEIAIDLFMENGIEDIIVVSGHNCSLLNPFVKKAGALAAENRKFLSGMLSSIQTGLENIRPDAKGFFLLPVDIPAIRPSSVQSILMVFEKKPDHIIMPYFDEISGHPPLIPISLKHQILGLTGESTLREVLFNENNPMMKLTLHDRGILMDADDKRGYQQLAEKFKNPDIPDKEECFSIINSVLAEDDDVRSHLVTVCFLALKLSEAIEEDMDIDLLTASALLHDICRKKKNHAQAGADFIRNLGFERVSYIIAQHMDIFIDKDKPVQEKEIVYFADKICNGNIVDLNYHQRFSSCLKKCPWALNSITKRYEDTRLIQTRIESSAKKSIEEILKDK
jgi:molybdenum cofactor cytidylyltransferase